MRRTNRGAGLYDALHSMGVFGAQAPSTLRAFATQGQLSPEQMLQRFGIEYEPVRHLLNEYLLERAPSLDHITLRSLAATLGRLFWRDLEIHHLGISSLNLAPDVAAAWNPPMPLLFQRRIGGINRSIPPDTIREWICRAVPVTSTADGSLTNSAGQPLRFTPHDFRRIFITDAVLHGMPPHIAQLVAGRIGRAVLDACCPPAARATAPARSNAPPPATTSATTNAARTVPASP